jgi:CBS domain-containing protein
MANHAASKMIPEKTVADVMSRDPVTLNLSDTLRLADDLMNLAHVRHFPVLDGERVAGVIDHDDLLHSSMASLVRRPNAAPRDVLGTVAIKDVMKPATQVAPHLSVHAAATMMVEHGVECLLVMDGDKLAGVVTRTDLLRELAKS